MLDRLDRGKEVSYTMTTQELLNEYVSQVNSHTGTNIINHADHDAHTDVDAEHNDYECMDYVDRDEDDE